MTQLIDADFSTKLNSLQRRARKAFENVCTNFLRNEEAENYTEIVHELISSYSPMGYNMSLNLHFLHFHFDFFLETSVTIRV